jgi:hypothetical protein
MGNSATKVALKNSVISIRDNMHLDEKDETFWSQLWLLPETVDDIFSFFNTQDIRTTMEKNPHNMATMLKSVANNLIQQVNSTVMFDNNTLLNSIRLLTKLMPIVFEQRNEQFECDIYWKVCT